MREAITNFLYGLRGVFALLLVMVAVFALGTLVMDEKCRDTLSRKLPVYPGAEMRFEQHNFLRAFGIGQTVAVLYTPDAEDVVREWYQRTIARNAKAARSGDRFWGVPQTQWTVGRDDGGTETQIILQGVCIG
ncbi:MAG: hypothetical protein H6672_06115 [Anaerolineaceae bacterium]|nr:hypothetical protein [Anaerolineaceae bacterium]